MFWASVTAASQRFKSAFLKSEISLQGQMKM